MAHRLSKLDPSLSRRGVVLAVEALIPEFDSAGDETRLFQPLKRGVDRPRLGLPIAGETLFEFPNQLIPIHRLLGQKQEQPKGDGPDFHAARRGPGHGITPTAKHAVVYMRRYPTHEPSVYGNR